jgi:hypothetical protein
MANPDKLLLPLPELKHGISTTPDILHQHPDLATIKNARVMENYELLGVTSYDTNVVTDPLNSTLAVVSGKVVVVDQDMGITIYD